MTRNLFQKYKKNLNVFLEDIRVANSEWGSVNVIALLDHGYFKYNKISFPIY